MSKTDRLLHDYCPFDDCPRKRLAVPFCMKRFLKVIGRYCPLFAYTEEERQQVFRQMEQGRTDFDF